MDIKTILIIALAALTVANGLYTFYKLPKAQRINNVKQWLRYAVVETEKALGAGTGQIKLRMAYDMAVKQYSWIAELVTFDTFSEWVDEALVWMNQQLEENKAAQEYVETK